jgi:hypothetical protein
MKKKMIRNNILFIALIINILPIKMQIPNNTMEQFLDRMLHESVYDRRIRPNFKDNKPTIIKMNMNINTISGISEVNMVIKILKL